MAFGRPRRPNDPSIMASLEVVLEVIRHRPGGRPAQPPQAWPYLPDRAEADDADADADEPALSGPGNHRPFG
jgi:hypothetical protein